MSPHRNGGGPDKSDPAFESLLEYIKEQRLFDFRGYKRASLMRRVQKRMQQVRVGDFEAYRDRLEVDPDEFTPLFNTILINVTSFFRDGPAWDVLAERVIPQILRAKKAGDSVRVWSAGCASGEEAYTLAMLLAEALGPEAFHQRVKIYGTDVDEEALEEARHAVYDDNALEGVPEALREKYFAPNGARRLFRADLRRQVIFGRHDLVQDAPISHIDLLVCRNTLMYFDSETQGKILGRLHFALKDTGFLFVGRAEMLLSRLNLFDPLDLKVRIFRKVTSLGDRERVLTLAQGTEENAERASSQAHLRGAALEVGPVAQVGVDAAGHLAFVNEKARTLFSLTERDLGSSFRDLEISYRPLELRSVIDQACAERRTVLVGNVERRLPGGERQFLDVQVVPLRNEAGSAQGVSIAFADVTALVESRRELQQASQERETAFEELQSANEELETTNEELQSTNEELETTNEELQSTNEELETMNEELQSTNEELQTMNEELRMRTEELDQARAFLQAIVRGLNVGVAVLDRDLRVTEWNLKAEDLWGIRADEAAGKGFLALDIGLPVEDLGPVLLDLDSGSAYREVVVDARNRRGQPIQCRVTATPLTHPSGEQLGAILIMEDWTGAGQEELRQEGRR